MRLNIGSRNIVKIEALKEVVNELPLFINTEIIEVTVSSEISKQPFFLREVINRAKSKASSSYKAFPCNYGIGIENGLMEAPTTGTGFVYVFVCSIFDGNQYFIGLSTGLEVPSKILRFMTNKSINFNQEFLESDVLLNDKIDRKQHNKQAIKNAISQLQNTISP